MDIQAPPSYEYVEPPPYAAHVNTASSPPAISPPQPELEHRYKGKNLVLCLGKNRFRTLIPVYRQNEHITGHVLIKRNIKKVKSIKVHIKGISVVRSSKGGSQQVSILEASQTLLEPLEGQQDITCMEGLYPFTFTLPSYVTGGMEPLPPSASFIHGGITTNVIYVIRVEMIRNGKFRANERWAWDFLRLSSKDLDVLICFESMPSL
ncbi:hypothetical protein Clacol_010138 [Clathrus columnatus]|uniref:Arrestin-like N-terminal domain-containing protein n=1 Tax=Clathrus columnatus TaxID=1419009 RepID=A0AAV5ASZ2_9AGAM|nr:hypothetical protein Clacol_010138 [Clathrus columnatus]